MINTEKCKKAISDWIEKNPGTIYKQYSFALEPNESAPPTLEEFEKPAINIKSWKRILKSKTNYKGRENVYERVFECSSTEQARKHFEDTLRAYVYATDDEILEVIVTAE